MRASNTVTGMSLLEQVLALGLVGLLLLMIATMAIKSRQSSASSRRNFEASCAAQNLLEKQLTRPLPDLVIGASPPVSGSFNDGLNYQAVVEVYSLHGQGPATGLSDAQIKRVRVRVTWVDNIGSHQKETESFVTKIPR